MARTKKKNKKLGKGGKAALIAFGALLLTLGAIMGAAALNANIVRVRRAEVTLSDLPDAFDGVTLLYASDVDLCGMNSAKKSGKLFRQLQSLSPDLLILGGDYNSLSLFERLNRPEGETENARKQLQQRTDFFYFIRDFEAPLGKYALASPEDGDFGNLAQLMTECGFQPIINAMAEVRRGNDSLWLTGISVESADLNSAGSAFHRGDCVIAACYSPTVLPILLTSEASDGGPWTDLVLCGHTHGGQIRLFGRSALQLNTTEQRYRSGWTLENGLPILTTEGIGCEGANLRIGTSPEVWLITLHKNVSRETLPEAGD